MAAAGTVGSGANHPNSQDSGMPEGSSTGFSDASHKEDRSPTPPKPNLWKRFQQSWTKAGLNTTTILLMIKYVACELIRKRFH